MKNNRHIVAGLMSGTSVDGLDCAFVEFDTSTDNITFKVLYANTFTYSEPLTENLVHATAMEAEDLDKLDHELGVFYAECVQAAISEMGILPDFIASHGHTVFHQPENGFTLQIGNATEMAGITGLPVIHDFRSEDVRKGGQGAPLVPIGDRDLFSEFAFCLNLGGIANISYTYDERLYACDIAPCNLVLNKLAMERGLRYDHSGAIASSGRIEPALLADLNQLEYYENNPPKSMGKEWVDTNILTILESSALPLPDKMRTCCEHISLQIARFVKNTGVKGSLLITGGGAYNQFLIGLIRNNLLHEIVIPDDTVIQFKEAIIFAYLGLLRQLGKVNILSSVTGAVSDSSAGTIITP